MVLLMVFNRLRMLDSPPARALGGTNKSVKATKRTHFLLVASFRSRRLSNANALCFICALLSLPRLILLPARGQLPPSPQEISLPTPSTPESWAPRGCFQATRLGIAALVRRS